MKTYNWLRHVFDENKSWPYMHHNHTDRLAVWVISDAKALDRIEYANPYNTLEELSQKFPFESGDEFVSDVSLIAPFLKEEKTCTHSPNLTRTIKSNTCEAIRTVQITPNNFLDGLISFAVSGREHKPHPTYVMTDAYYPINQANVLSLKDLIFAMTNFCQSLEKELVAKVS